MDRLYIVSMVLCRMNIQTGAYTTKPTLSYRNAPNPDAALGATIRIMMDAYKEWGIEKYMISEILPEHIAQVYEDQKGKWEIPVVTEVIKPEGETGEPLPTNGSV